MIKKHQLRILVLGESTSYGLLLPSRTEQAYPYLLKKSLQEILPQKEISLVNASVPGQTSFSILRSLDYNLASHQPHLVITHFGVNDANYALTPYGQYSFLSHSKLFKLVYFSYLYLRYQEKVFLGENGEFVFWDKDQDSTSQRVDYVERTSPNMRTILERLKRTKAKVIGLNYFKAPEMVYELINAEMNRAELPLIDLREIDSEGILSEDNWHPSIKGHQVIKDKILKFIQEHHQELLKN